MEILGVQKTTSCAVESDRIQTSNTWSVKLDLSSQCTVIYKIKTKALSSESYGFIPAKAMIRRVADLTDPDATNTDVNAALGDADAECMGGTCNNIFVNLDVFLLEPFEERGQLSLVKKAVVNDLNGDTFHQKGETISYTFEISNMGSVPVSQLEIADAKIQNTRLQVPQAVLHPNETIQFTVDYVLQAADVDLEQVINSATIWGKNPRNFNVTDKSGTAIDNADSTRTVLDIMPEIRLRKEVFNQGRARQGLFTIGDQINYKFTVLNRSKKTLYHVQLLDLLLSSSRISLATPHLGSHQELQYTASYTVTEADIDRGFVSNTAIIYGREGGQNREVWDISGATFDDDLPTITLLSKRPEVQNDWIPLKQNISLTVPILANDLFSESVDISSLTLEQSSLMGRVRQLPTGAIVYTPALNFFGMDTLYYRIADVHGLYSKWAQVIFEVQQSKPVAMDDDYRLRFNTLVYLDVLKNDRAEEGTVLNPQSIVFTRNPSQGFLKTTGDGSWIYIPQQHSTGEDYALYKVQDSNGNWSNEARITLHTYGFKIPTVFTPNGDGLNDQFMLVGLNLYDRVAVSIFTRTGVQVYENEDYANNWDGGDLVSQTYYYLIRTFKAGQEERYTGTLLLKRQ